MTHEHLTDEQLSAHLDGEPSEPSEPSATGVDGSVDVRIADCETCRRRLAALSDARALVRRPVGAVPPSVRTTAVASAITEVLGPETGAGAISELAAHPSRRPGRSAPVLAGTAAAAVLVVAVGVSLGLSHGSSPTASSASSPVTGHAPATRHATEPEGVPQKAAAPGTTTVRDLGSVSSPQDLRSRLAPLVGTGADLGVQATVAGPAGQDNTAVAPSPGSFAAAGTVPAPLATCVAAAERASGTAGTLELVATATYDHTPALVVVTEVTGASSKAVSAPLAVVVARSGCRVLARTTA
ncbi:MAG TPA: hypothetical protein VN791_07515 [Acidimicrobiales bacterium]|nr:hypothetical protein [Acidimicrobiales bacterium]